MIALTVILVLTAALPRVLGRPSCAVGASKQVPIVRSHIPSISIASDASKDFQMMWVFLYQTLRHLGGSMGVLKNEVPLIWTQILESLTEGAQNRTTNICKTSHPIITAPATCATNMA